MQHGGKRTGAGRPQGSKAAHTLEAEALRQYIIEETIKNKGPIVAALIKQASEGNIPAVKELLDRIFGKANAFLEISDQQERQKLQEQSSQLKEIIENIRTKYKQN